MDRSNRREFLAEVGQGMLLASVGSALASDLGFGSVAMAEEKAKGTLAFGDLEPLVSLMQQTPVDKLLPALVQRLQTGTSLRQLVAAGALANAREFGGNDYVGFHTFMALGPAFAMSQELPETHRALPVLKVLYRNTDRCHQFGGHGKEMLHPIETVASGHPTGEDLRRATRAADNDAAEAAFAAMMQGPAGEAYNHLQYAVEDEVDVHRVVLAWRAWSTLDLTGKEHAHTLLRQSVRYCVDNERYWKEKRPADYETRINSPTHIRNLLPKLLDQFSLLSKPLGSRRVDDAWLDRTSREIVAAKPEQAAEIAAGALADGISPEDVGEAISLASNELLLRDKAARTHGDSKGVHASDSANAWRNIARVSNHRNTVASLIVGAYHTAGQGRDLHADFYPWTDHLQKVTATEPDALLKAVDAAIRENNQTQACAVVQKYGQLGLSSRPMFDLLLKFAISEDGRLHNEKYYRTVCEEFATLRPAFRWRQVTALARVMASSYGYNREDKQTGRAPGYEEACRLLRIEPAVS